MIKLLREAAVTLFLAALFFAGFFAVLGHKAPTHFIYFQF